MNADRLLAHFDRIADAPDAIPRLRRFILDLAVRGKLVEQDSNDEPASEMLKRIAAEKARHAKAGNDRKRASSLSCKPIEPDSPIPATWHLVRLAEISNIVMGQSPPGHTYNTNGEGVPLINGPVEFSDRPFGMTVLNQYTTTPTHCCAKGDFLICVRGSTTGRSNIAAFDACIGRGVAAIQPLFDDQFVRLFLWNMRERLISMGRGIAFPSITRKQIEDLPVPLPPLPEQHRIVAKVDELMTLCDRLEAGRAGREATRERLAAASLARLNAPDPDPATFRDHAAFALDNLDPLTARRDQIKALRQTILNLAVRGKLVEQHPNDEPASELLGRIETKRETLYAAGLIPRPKNLPPLRRKAHPFSLPNGWTWSMLGQLCYRVADGPHFSPQYVPAGEGVPFLSTRNVRPDGFDLSSMKYVSRHDHEEFCKRIRPEENDIIYTKGGTTGIAKLNDLDMEFSIWVHLAVLRIEKKWLAPRYLELALNSPHCYEQSQQYTRGISNFDLGLTRMIKITVPLPPVAEQHRIVAKIDELMAICDRLEASLKSSDDTRSNVVNALVHEALEPTADRAATA